MSKIYEALRQAELDRAKGGTTQVESATDSPGSAAGVLDTTAFTPAFSSGAKTWATVQPIARGFGDKAQAAPHSDSADSAAVLIDLPAIELDRIQQVAWSPLLGQLPALEERGSAVE